MFMYYDPQYLLMMLPVLLISLYAQWKVNSSFKKYSKVRNQRYLTGAQAAEAVLRANGVQNVRIERVRGNLTDHYDPKTNVIRLSDSVYDSPTISAVGVAAHEAGHAVQYAVGYAPIHLRAAMVGITNFGSQFGIILLMIGLLLSAASLFYIGIILFSLTAVFQLVTLPVEFNASRRAMVAIEDTGLLSDTEARGARKVLSAAALTYVAALLTSVMQLLYYISRFNGGRRDRR
jgi:Zn-dependent membrane protease YugP